MAVVKRSGEDALNINTNVQSMRRDGISSFKNCWWFIIMPHLVITIRLWVSLRSGGKLEFGDLLLLDEK